MDMQTLLLYAAPVFPFAISVYERWRYRQAAQGEAFLRRRCLYAVSLGHGRSSTEWGENDRNKIN